MPGTPRAALGCLALLVLPILSSCASGTSAQSSSTSVSQSPTSFSVQPANPVNVTEHLDTAKASSATLDARGGTVTATGSGGVVFTLTIPPKALLVSQHITLTPVTSIDGLPFHGGLSAAVHLQPDGLTFFEPATLTILGNPASPTGYAPIGFEYQGMGTGLHFYPTKQGSGLEFMLMHFTSPGVGGISRQDLNNQLSHNPEDNLAQIEQYIAALDATQHQLQLFGAQALSSEALQARYAAVLATQERLVVKPAIAAATRTGASYEDVSSALRELKAWAQRSEIYSIDQPDYPGLLASLERVLPDLFKTLVNACFTNDDIRAALRAFSILRYDQDLLGGALNLPFDPISRCLHFQLDFETQLSGMRPPAGGSAEMHLKASSVPVAMASSDDGGSAPLAYLSYKYTIPTLTVPSQNCAWTTISAVGIDPFQVLSAQGFTFDDQPANEWGIIDFMLLLDPGTATETVSMECRPFGHPTGTFPVGPFHDYQTFWGLLHSDQVVEYCPGNPPRCHAPAYAISGWQIVGRRLFARRTFQRSAHDDPLGLGVDETTTLDLFHTPQGGPNG